jgi:hypothetical protein
VRSSASTSKRAYRIFRLPPLPMKRRSCSSLVRPYSVVDSYEVTMWYTIPSILWIKKLLAKNSSSVVYSGSAYGWKQTTSTWCA